MIKDHKQLKDYLQRHLEINTELAKQATESYLNNPSANKK